jgi:hypothetical protein
VTRTIWLASYPKSGNTWLRMLVANLSAKDDQPVDINDLPERGGIASARGPFDHLLLIDSGLLTHDEVDCLRPRVYEQLARGAQDDEYDAPEAAPPVRLVNIISNLRSRRLFRLSRRLPAEREGPALPIVRVERSQKSARSVHLSDLADYIEIRRQAALKEHRQLTGAE